MQPKKSALLIIDMQKDVVKKHGPFALSVIAPIQKALELCRKKKMPIIYILREHRKSGVDVEKFRLSLFKEKPHVIEDSDGAKVIEELTPTADDFFVSKRRFSGFFQTDLLLLLTRLGIQELVLTGVQTPNCIRATAVDAIGYDFDVTILADATNAINPEVQKANLFDMGNMGITILSTDQFIESGASA